MTICILVDVEARGTSPFSGEMTEFGAVALNKTMTAVQGTFHGKLIEAVPDRTNPAIPFIPPNAKRYNEKEVMEKFHKWLLSFGERVVAVSDNNSYDLGTWITPYFDRNGLENPFGHSSRRISDFAAGLKGDWNNTQKWKKLRVTKHTHHPVSDAMGNAESLISLIALSRGERSVEF